MVADSSATAFVGRAAHTAAGDLAVHTDAKALVGWAVHTDTEPHTAVEALVELKVSRFDMSDLVFPVGDSFDLSAFVGRAGGSFDLSEFAGPAGGGFDLLAFVGQVDGSSILLMKLGTLLS